MKTLRESLTLVSNKDTTFVSSLDSQNTHRMNILQSWIKIAQGNRYDLDSNIIGKQILDIGCGQGDMIAVFAAVLKAQGNKESRVIGIDPASLDYGESARVESLYAMLNQLIGSPWTLGEAQSNLSAGPLNEYLQFKQTTALELMGSQPRGTYTAAYFVHSLYYFPSSAALIQNFKALLDAGVKTLLLAEWSLSISTPSALPHLLAVLLQSIDPLPDGNVRTVLSPAAYIEAATQAGWKFVGSEMFTPADEQEDGIWETKIARSVVEKYSTGVDRPQMSVERSAETIRFESIRAHADALEASITSEAGMDGIECMDAWTAVFENPSRADSSSRPDLGR